MGFLERRTHSRPPGLSFQDSMSSLKPLVLWHTACGLQQSLTPSLTVQPREPLQSLGTHWGILGAQGDRPPSGSFSSFAGPVQVDTGGVEGF